MRLNNWAENYQIYVEAQLGFRKNMCTVDNDFILHGILTHSFNDFEVRYSLWYKLLKYGVRGKIINLIQSMYTHLKEGSQ